MAKKVRFPPIVPTLNGDEMSYEFPRTQSDITTTKSDLRAKQSLQKQNSEMFTVSQRRERTKRSVSLEAITVNKEKKTMISPPTQTKKSAFITQDDVEGLSRVSSMASTKSLLPSHPISLSPSPSFPLSHSSSSPTPSSTSPQQKRKMKRRSPSTPLSPLSVSPSHSPLSTVSSSLSFAPTSSFNNYNYSYNNNNNNNTTNKRISEQLAQWEQVPAECLAFLEDLNSRPSDLWQKQPLPKKTVSYDEIFRAIQTKEELSKKVNAMKEENEESERELKDVEQRIADLKNQLSLAEGEWQNSLVEVAKTDARKYKLGNVKQMCLEETDQRDRNMNEKIEAEKELDNLNAELSTLQVIKKAMQMKLFQASEEKNSIIQNRKAHEDTFETEKTALFAKMSELSNHNNRLEEMMERAKVKVEQQTASEKSLEEQLSKAKDQVVSLIEQIGQKEAREARELRAQRAAREAEARAKHRHPSGEVTLVFTDVQGSTAQWELHPDVMSVALELHNSILRAKLQLTGGYEVRTEGDSFMVAFHTPLSAVWWCVFVQQALLEADWPARLLSSPHSAEEHAEDGTLLFRGIRVRMGAHVGRAQTHVDALTGRMDYFGPMVNRAVFDEKEISGMGRGGQILLSGSVWNAVRADMGSTVVASHIGEIKSKNINNNNKTINTTTGTNTNNAGNNNNNNNNGNSSNTNNANNNNNLISIKIQAADDTEEIFQILPNSLSKRKFSPLKPVATIVPSDSRSKLSLARIYQNRMEEEIQNNEKTNTEARAKLAVLFKEIETSLAEQEFEKRRAEIAKMCYIIKKKVRDVRRWTIETEKVVAHSTAELDVMKYKIEKCEDKNVIMEQDIIKLQAEQQIYKDLLEEMEEEQRTKRATLQKLNALTFALMVKELTLAQSDHAMSAERDLLERQERECGEIVKALEGEQNFNAKLVINHIFERNKLLEQHIAQAKRDELEARALLQDANFEFEKFRNEIETKSKANVSNFSKIDVEGIANLAPGELIKKSAPQVVNEYREMKKKILQSEMAQMDEEKADLEAKAKELEAQLMDQTTGGNSAARALKKIKALDFQIKRLTSEKGMLTSRSKKIHLQIENARARTVACVAAVKDSCAELAVRREVLEDQLEAFAQPIPFNNNNGSDGTGKEGTKLHLSLHTANVGMDGIVGGLRASMNNGMVINNIGESNRSNRGKLSNSRRSISPTGSLI